MGIWGWVQAIATGWFVLSILLAVAWALGGKRIFRQPPAPPRNSGLHFTGKPSRVEYNGVDLTPYVIDLDVAYRKRNPKAGA